MAEELLKSSASLRSQFNRAYQALNQPTRVERIKISAGGPSVQLFNAKDKAYFNSVVKNTMIGIVEEELEAQEKAFKARPFTLFVDNRQSKSIDQVKRRIQVKWRESNRIDIGKLKLAVRAAIYRRVRYRSGLLGQVDCMYDKRYVTTGSVDVESGKALVLRLVAPYSSFVSSRYGQSRSRVVKRGKRKGAAVRGKSLLVNVRQDLQKIYPGWTIRARVALDSTPHPGIRRPVKLLLSFTARLNARLI